MARGGLLLGKDRISRQHHTSKWTRIFEQEPGDSQVSGHCGEKKHRGLAVLVGLIVKLSPLANSPWVGKGPPCHSVGGGRVLQKRGTVR